MGDRPTPDAAISDQLLWLRSEGTWLECVGAALSKASDEDQALRLLVDVRERTAEASAAAVLGEDLEEADAP